MSHKPLTPNELAILRLTALGLIDRSIAQRVGLTENTVKTMQKRLRAKLGARDRSHAVAMGYESGLLRTGTVVSGLELPGNEQRLRFLEEQVVKLISEVRSLSLRQRKKEDA